MIRITHTISLLETEIDISFIRAAGPGGQNVNKVATAAQLRFDVFNSPSLTDDIKQRLIKIAGQRMTQSGLIIIKANRHRTQERNKQDALSRLKDLILLATVVPKKRKKTKPTRASKERRLATKKLHSQTKSLRNKKID